MTRWPVALVLLAAMAVGQEQPWTRRFSNFENITPEQRAQGATPDFAFQDRVEDGVRILSLDDDERGMRIGQVYLGRPLQLGTPRPKNLQVSFELQTDCATPDRTPTITVMLLTQEGWELLSEDPVTGGPPPRWTRTQQIAKQAAAHPENATEWVAFKSSNLAPSFNGLTPETLWLVIAFGANHVGSVEYCRLRHVEVTMGMTPPPVPDRVPRGPLKSSRAFHSDAEIATARQRIAESEEAKAVLDGIISRAQPWLDMPLEDLTWRMPGGDVPRAFNDSVGGCPVHGKAIFQHGTYPWILHFDKPFQLECPIGHESYPSNDFLAWYRSGYEDQTALGGDYSDDGWGWVHPKTGERQWLIAYANHWTWSKFTLPGMTALAQAYQLTGDRRYADRCVAMLARMADIYPGLDYEPQSRYGHLNPGYRGKLLNHIWETGTISTLAEAYDMVWETIDSNESLLASREQTGEQLRAEIEANLLEEGVDGILDGRIVGNFGMHQRAMAILVAVRQPDNSAQLLSEILDKTGAEGRYEGIRYALHNWIHRDGVPYETSPGYNFSWVANLTETAALVERAGVDLFQEPQFRRLLNWPLMLLVNDHTPAEGDAGSIAAGRVGITHPVYREAFRRYGGTDFAWALQQGGIEERSYNSFDSLFEPVLAEQVKAQLAAEPRATPVTRLLDGYGMALLNNPTDRLGVSNYYGYRGGHSHRDGLTFDLFAHGLAITPDTGYPDFMNNLIAGIYTWSKATIAHNTVTVDERQQTGNLGGQVHHFAGSPELQFSDISAPGNYPGVSVYRRALALISLGDDDGYLVDVFRVTGGRQHDYSLHGTVGEATVVDGRFSAVQTKGTLAGEDVAVGQIYDDPVMGAEGYSGGYGGYHGSGFQHLINVRRQLDDGAVAVEVTPTVEPPVKLRLHLTAQPGQQAILAQAQISPVKQTDLLPYLIARRTGQEGLASTFATVLEPFGDQPLLTKVERMPMAGDAIALRVTHAAGTDLIVQQPESGVDQAVADRLQTDGAVTVLRLAPDGHAVKVLAVGATRVSVDGQPVTIPAPRRGKLAAVDPETDTVTVAWGGPAPDANALVGATLRLGDGRLSTHTVIAAQAVAGGQALTLRDSLTSGIARVTGIDEAARTVRTDTRLTFEPTYPGQWLLPEGGDAWLPITACARGVFTVGGPAELGALLADADGDGTQQFRVLITAPGQPVILEPAVSMLLHG